MQLGALEPWRNLGTEVESKGALWHTVATSPLEIGDPRVSLKMDAREAFFSQSVIQ